MEEDHASDSDIPHMISPIDKLTMELLMNKQNYAKYLSKTDPTKYEEFARYRQTLAKYHDGIMGITQQLLCEHNKQFNNEISETFHHFTRACIKYLEDQELCSKDLTGGHSEEYHENNDEDETLFDERYMKSTDTAETSGNFPKSFWGKQVYKSMPAGKTGHMLSLDMAAFSGKKFASSK
jgi:hypothetical protein